MQTLSQQIQQAQTTLNKWERKPILQLPTAAVQETLTQCYMMLVAMDAKDCRNGIEADLVSIAYWLTTPQKQGIILQGNVGVGKTTLARAMFATMKFHGAPAVGCTAANLASIYKDSEKEQYWRLKNARRLFIDDLGAEYRSVKNYGEEFSPILDILTTYYKERKTLIITTNLTMANISNRYGERISDRLGELCNYYELSNTQSFRK